LAVVTVDLLKMHPMARKMNAHNEAFAKAIEDGNADGANEHLVEILKYASTLQEDLHYAVKKSESQVVTPSEDMYANNVKLLKWNETGSNFDPSMRDRQLPGTIISARNNSRMQPARSTFGRRV